MKKVTYFRGLWILGAETVPKCLVATFGWTEHHVLSSILKYGIEGGDYVTLLVPAKRDEKSESVIKDFASFLGRYGGGIRPEVKRIPIDRFDETVAAISEILREALSREPDKLIVNLSGGMRILVLATYVSVLLTCPRDTVIELETEDRERSLQIPNLSLWSTMRIKDLEWKILERLGHAEISVSELLRYLRVPRSTLHKYLKRLEERGIVATKRSGRSLTAGLTPLGRLMLLGAWRPDRYIRPVELRRG